jgi:2-hydroxy-6-oxonona-2,4-dienedioate hydrolase
MATNGHGDFASIWSDLRGAAFQQGYIDANGVKTRYLSSGSPDKPLLIMIHGTGGHAECYSRNLASHGEHFWTFAIDLIGHGWSSKPDCAYEISDYAAHVVDVIKALGRSSAHISGESLGGWVAAQIAINSPVSVDRLALNTTGGWTAHPDVMARIKELSTKAVEDPTYEFLKSRLEFLMFDKSLVNDDLIEARRAIYSQPGYKETMARILCLQDMEIRQRNMISAEQFGSIKAPTLVLWTSHDPTATPDEGKQIADLIPNSTFVVMNECGHWPQFEDPETFNRIHLDFLLAN